MLAMERKIHGLQVLICMLIAIVPVVVNPPRSMSQTVTGSILGTVRDPQGAVVPSAAVAAKNVDTGIERTALSDGSGGFVIASVPAGDYSVTVSAPGFQP